MVGEQDMGDVDGADVLDPGAAVIGTVGAVYFDAETEEPVWVAVRTAQGGEGEALVPLEGAVFDRGALRLTFAGWIVEQAPRLPAPAELTVEEQDRLFRYYEIADWPTSGGPAVRGRAGLQVVEERRRARDAETGGSGVGADVNTQQGN